jgi:GntR family transcriptional regulator, transcriptional repressor for pyruvate dehydrogenase complex
MTSTPNSPFKALEQRRAFEQIIFQIEEAILEGRLRPGDRLPAERTLAETFGVSRASVREALRVLEVFGVVVARRGTGPDAGSIVAEGAGDGLANALRLHAGLLRIGTRDIVDIRAVLEGHAAREAARSKPADGIGELRELIDTMRAAEDIEAYHRVDTEFHVALARASGNALLPVLMEALRNTMQRDMVDGFSQLDDWRAMRDRLVKEHTTIVDRIADGDPEGAATALVAHIMGFYRSAMDR